MSGTKIFTVDDPLDPANKVLAQEAVATPQAEDVYNGNITTDAHGYSTVTLPAYFDAENTDPRYQLTVIGSFAQAVVWKQERRNQFEIRTNQGHVEVRGRYRLCATTRRRAPAHKGPSRRSPRPSAGDISIRPHTESRRAWRSASPKPLAGRKAGRRSGKRHRRSGRRRRRAAGLDEPAQDPCMSTVVWLLHQVASPNCW